MIKVGPPHGNPSMGLPVISPNAPIHVPAAPVVPSVPVSAPGSRIYVGSVNYELNSDDIRAAFSICGTVVSCQLMVSLALYNPSIRLIFMLSAKPRNWEA